MNEIEQFFQVNSILNSKVITLIRLDLMILLYYSIDGMQYRELKAALQISDGKIKSDLDNLRNMGYIRRKEVEMDNRKLTIYFLTDLGKKELEKIIKWMKTIIKLVEN
ncbi:MAG: transcriptional regulator [Promethearchaeota archaeon]